MKRLKECLELSILQNLSVFEKIRLFMIMIIVIMCIPFYYICKTLKNK